MQYELAGGAFPVVICSLQDGEQMITEKGSMVWMTPSIQMETSGGGLGKMFSRAFSGESMFQNIYTSKGQGTIAFGSSFPGRIMPVEIGPGREMILQKNAFLASEAGVELSIHFSKKLGAGVAGFEPSVSMDIRQVPGLKNKLLGGEGLFNTLLTGPGKVWLQTMPISNVAMAIRPFIPTGNG